MGKLLYWDTPRGRVYNGFELSYRTWLRRQTAREDTVGYVARQYAKRHQPEPIDCLEDEWARCRFACEAWYSDERPED